MSNPFVANSAVGRKSGRLFFALKVAHKLDPTLPVGYASVFLLVATRPGITVSELMSDLKLNQPAVVRALQRLGHGSRSPAVGKPLGLVITERDPEEGRRYICRLSPKGQRLLEQMVKPL